MFLALVLKVCRNRFSCHGRSVAELSPPKLSNFGHSLTIYLPPRGGLMEKARRCLEVSNFEQSHNGGDTNIQNCLTRVSPEKGGLSLAQAGLVSTGLATFDLTSASVFRTLVRRRIQP